MMNDDVSCGKVSCTTPLGCHVARCCQCLVVRCQLITLKGASLTCGKVLLCVVW